MIRGFELEAESFEQSIGPLTVAHLSDSASFSVALPLRDLTGNRRGSVPTTHKWDWAG